MAKKPITESENKPGAAKPARDKATRARARPDGGLKGNGSETLQTPQAFESKLSDDQKEFVVTSLACFDTPSQVQKALKAEFGVDIAVQSVEAYNPERAAGKSLAKQWKALFETTRKAFLEEKAEIPIANKAVRLRIRERMARKAESAGNIALANELLNDAAREVGESFTNARIVKGTGANGAHQVEGLKQLFDLIDGGTRSLVPPASSAPTKS